MKRAEATIVTTAVPMRGYEEALLGADVCTARLRDLSDAFQAGRRFEVRDAPCFDSLAPLQGSVHGYYYMAEETIVTTAVPMRGYEEVRVAYLAFLLVAIKACAKGELTEPIVLRGQAGVGGKIDLRSGRWVVERNIAPQYSTDVIAFLENVYDLGQRDLQAATDTVFDTIDRLLCDGREELCDEILAAVEVSRVPSALLRSFLTITAPAKEKLRSRPTFFDKAYAEVERQRGPEKARRLLGRLA